MMDLRLHFADMSKCRRLVRWVQQFIPLHFWGWEFKFNMSKILFLVKTLPGLHMASFWLWPQGSFICVSIERKSAP